MSGTTNVPAPYFGPNGFVAPSEAAVLTGVLEDMNSAFGGFLNVTNLSTPQGQLASSETAIIGDCNSQFLALVNNIDPAFSSGRFQDALGRIYFISRIPASSTVVQVACTGAAGVQIPVGALLVASDNTQYVCTAAITIDVTGTVTTTFEATTSGPVVCPPQQFAIYRSISGWDTAISTAAGALGNLVETRAAFELRRQASVAMNAIGSVPSIRGAVLACPNVIDAYVIDNPTSSPVAVNGVTLLANSVYVAVLGGVASQIANAIWTKKSLGCNMNGNTTVTVTDTSSPSLPQPTYGITYETPVQTPVLFAITMANNPGVPANVLSLVQQAIIGAMAGGDGGPRARIGTTLYASRFYSTLAALGPWAQIISVQIGTTVANLNSLILPVNQAPVTAAANIALTLV